MWGFDATSVTADSPAASRPLAPGFSSGAGAPMKASMASPNDPQGGGIDVSPEEEHFLRGFVRRQLVPWTLGLLIVTSAVAWGLRGDDASAIETRTAAALAQVRSENQKLRAEFESMQVEMGNASTSPTGTDELERRIENAKANVRMIESRITASLDRRIAGLEAQLASGVPAAAPASATAPPAEAAAWDVSAILDRLYALEMREDGGGAASQRIAQLERRVIQLEAAAQGVPIPAAPAPAGGY